MTEETAPAADEAPAAIFRRAQAHHRAGRFAEAERLYRAILEREPGHAPALHYLGLLAHRAGRTEHGIVLVREALAKDPRDAGAHTNLSMLALASGRALEAEVHARLAIALREPVAEAHVNLALALARVGDIDEALVHWRRALELAPESPAARAGLSTAELARLDRAPAPDPAARAAALVASGREIKTLGLREAALALFRRAVAIAPGDAQAQFALGTALVEAGALEEAEAACRRALAIDPGHGPALGNLGIALQEQGKAEEALEVLDRAVARAPDDALAHWNRALLLLRLGRLEEGFAAFEWRWKLKGRAPRAGAPWDGDALDGRTILLHAEQGIGDTVQCLRFVPAVAARGGRVLLAVQRPLEPLVGRIAGVARLVAEGTAIPPFDVQAPLMSLPRLLGVTLDTIPPPARLALPASSAAADLVRAAEGRRVGLAWAGRPSHHNDRRRSCPPAFLAPLADCPGTRFFSLQVSAGPRTPAASWRDLPPLLRNRTTDLGPRIAALADMAAAIAALDLVVTVDTAVAHLAGSLGVPTWLLLSHVADWRWLRARDDSPWYPSIRILRQPRPHDWPAVVRAVAERLRHPV